MREEQLIPEGTPVQQALRITAADWLQRLNDDAISDAEIADWLKWYREHQAHRQAFDRAELLFRKLRTASPTRKETIRQTLKVHAKNVRPRRMRLTAQSAWRALAASVILFGTALAVWHLSVHESRTGGQRYKTARGEHRKVTLPDGSVAMVGGRTTLEVAFTSQLRRLRIISGEAFFDVKPQAARPFVVQAGPASVTALGTAFDVRLSKSRIAVSVVNGTVEVKRRAQIFPLARKALRLAAGEQVVMPAGPMLAGKAPPKVTRIEPTSVMAWQKGYFSVAGEPLKSVVESVNRYAKRQVEIGDASVGEMTYVGTVYWDRTEEWIENLPQIFPLRTVKQSDGTIILMEKAKK